MSALDQQGTHDPSPQRIRRAREEGDVAHSHELAAAVQMVAGVGALWFLAASIGNSLQQETVSIWQNSSISAAPEAIVRTTSDLLLKTIQISLPMLISIFVIGSLAHLVQTRFLVNRPKVRFSSLTGKRWLDNVFSFSNIGRLLVVSPKLLLSLLAGGAAAWTYRQSFIEIGNLPANLIPAAILKVTATIGMSVALTLLVCSFADYALSWFSFQQRLKMSDRELREELRGQSGDPQIARIRHQRMREITRERNDA